MIKVEDIPDLNQEKNCNQALGLLLIRDLPPILHRGEGE